MASMIQHLFCGKVILDSMAVVKNDLQINEPGNFLAGNIIPDLALNKHDAHYYHRAKNSSFLVPDLDLADKALSTIPNQSLRQGVRAHLYLDHRFIKDFLMQRFEFDPGVGVVKSKFSRDIWAPDAFFSKAGLYRGYGECNPLFLRDELISLDYIYASVPETLPETGIISLDLRNPRSWQGQLEWFLTDPPEYTGAILDYGELVSFIRQCAADFACGVPLER